MSNIFNQSPFLRTSRMFPVDPEALSSELSKSYIDIANIVNDRTIGTFAVNKQAMGGESWFLSQNRKQQNLRQVYQWDDSNLTIAHGINLNNLTHFTRMYGTFYNSTSSTWNTLPFIDVVTDVTYQITFSVTSTSIVISKGSNAPSCSNGIIVLEWIANINNK